MALDEREHKERHGLRILFMAMFWIVLRLGVWLTGLMALLQWIMGWFEDEPNQRLRGFGLSLSTYLRQILDYLLFNSDQKPFPFDDWPRAEIEEEG